MAAKLITSIKRIVGTAAEIAAVTLTDYPVGSTFFESDTGILKILDQSGALVNAPSESAVVQLSGSIIPDGQEVPVSINETYLTNATPWFQTQDSGAGAAQTITIAAESGKAHYITYFEVVIGVAATTAELSVTILDGVTVKYKSVIIATAPVGTRIAVQLPYPITISVGVACSLVVGDPDGATVTTANFGGYTM